MSRSNAAGPDGLAAWRAEVIDLQAGRITTVRELRASGTTLGAPVVWSEVFAACDDPMVIVRWSDLRLSDAVGATTVVDEVRVNYQAIGDGGCARTNSTVSADGASFEQATATERRTSICAAW